MLLFLSIYYLIGLVIACLNIKIFYMLQPKEEHENDILSTIINIFSWVILWPLGIIHIIIFISEIIKRRKNENS